MSSCNETISNRHEMNGQSVEHCKNDSPFDYRNLPSSVTDFLKGQAHRIRRQAAMSIIHIGKDLIAAKHYLSHGAFLNWVVAEVDIPPRTAQAYMQVAQWATGKNATVALLPPSLLYFLSASRTPETFVDDILRRIEAGEHVALSAIRDELKALRISHREGSPDNERAARQGTQLDQKSWPTAVELEVTAILRRAVAILAQGLSVEDFAQVRDILTSKAVLEDPELPRKITTAFSVPVRNGRNINDTRRKFAVPVVEVHSGQAVA
jgi:hypothetical protein